MFPKCLWKSSLFNPIPHSIFCAHNFTVGGHIDPTTFEALWGPDYAPVWNVDQYI